MATSSVVDEEEEVESLGRKVLKRINELFDTQGLVFEETYRKANPAFGRDRIDDMVTDELKRLELHFRRQAINEIVPTDTRIQAIHRTMYRIIKEARDHKYHQYFSKKFDTPIPETAIPEVVENPKPGQMNFESILRQLD